MQLTLPPDVEALVQKRLATGAFANAEDVALDEKIDRALEQRATGRVYGPEEAGRKLAELRDAHIENPACIVGSSDG